MRQRERFQHDWESQNPDAPQPISANSDMHPKEIRRYCKLDPDSQSLMRSAMSQLQLSARAYHRVLKLSRTIADLAGENQIASQHLAEALQYRPKLNQY
jgi:magnesium chelatase family protein